MTPEPVLSKHIGQSPRSVRRLGPTESTISIYDAVSIGDDLGDRFVNVG
jgi:hypothetical protein